MIPRPMHCPAESSPCAPIHTIKREICPSPLFFGAAAASNDILSAFFYGRAFAVTLNKRLSEIAVDVISEVSKALAERPQRLREFQVSVARVVVWLACEGCCYVVCLVPSLHILRSTR